MHQRLIVLFFILMFLVGCTGGVATDTTPEATPPPQQPSPENQPVLAEKTPPPVKSEPVLPAQVTPTPIQSDLGDLLIIGEAEYVLIGAAETRLAARIDTGATTSSLDAREIKPYESDGKKWISFQVVERKSGKVIKFKRKLVRTAKVKRHGAEKQKRYIVKLPVKMGPIEQEIEFTLTDRSSFEFPVLIGRNFLKGVAIVDVDRKYSITPLVEN